MKITNGKKYHCKLLLEIDSLSTVPKFSAASSFKYAPVPLYNHLDISGKVVIWTE